MSPTGNKPGKRWNTVDDCSPNCFRKHKTLVSWWGSFTLLAIIWKHLYMKITIQTIVLMKSISLSLSHDFWDCKRCYLFHLPQTFQYYVWCSMCLSLWDYKFYPSIQHQGQPQVLTCFYLTFNIALFNVKPTKWKADLCLLPRNNSTYVNISEWTLGRLT